MTRVVPGPLRRLARQPLRAVAVVLLAVVALAASGIQSAAATALQSTLDANWRGAYDILVTPRDGMHAVKGMLPPNTLNSTLSGMTLDDLKKVRAVADVDVAAPIGTVLLPGLKWAMVNLAVPEGLPGTDSAPQAYRLAVTYTTDDGLGERVVWHDTNDFIVDESHDDTPASAAPGCGAEADPDQQVGLDDYTYRTGDYPALTRYNCETLTSSLNGVTSVIAQGMAFTDQRFGGAGDSVYALSLPETALTATRITLVDPQAEKALLGDDGDYLDPLIATDPSPETDLNALDAWAQHDDSALARDFTKAHAEMSGYGSEYPADVLADLRRLWKANGDDWDTWVAEHVENGAAVPLLISQAPTASLSVKIDIEAFGAAKAEGGSATDRPEYTLPAAQTDGGVGTSVGTSTADVSAALNTFSDTQPLVAWPGDDSDVSLPAYALRSLRGAEKSVAYGYTASGGDVRLDASGYRDPLDTGGILQTSADPTALGSEAAYQLLDKISDLTATRAPVAVPVGTFDPSQIGPLQGSASFVPLGAYDDVDVAVSDGPHAGATMQPAISGTGLVSTRTAAIASIASASLWEDDAPVDAIRVRVADVGGYSADAQHKIIAVAQAIEKLGFEATVVAGSSPTEVAFDVTGYAFGTMDPNGTQTVGDLGTVTQRWSELGAAARVDLSVSTATYAMLGIGLVAVLLLMGTVQLAAIPGRRMQARAMRDVGFTRARIARWYAAEEVPGWLIVALVGGAAIVLAADRPLAALVVGAALVVIAVVAAVSVAAGSRSRIATRPRGVTSRRVGAASIIGFGARQARIHPLSSVVHTFAIVVVGVACAGLVAVALTARGEAGGSLLAGLTWVRMLWPQLALGIAGIGGGLLLARLVRRIDLDRRAGQWRVLRAAGWTAGQLVAAQRAEGTVVALPAIGLAALAAWGGAVALGVEPTWLSAAISASAGALCALLAFTARGRGRDA